jgi:hypothetical protein
LFIHGPTAVSPIPTINGLSTEPERVTPIDVAPPYGHSVNGVGGVVCGVLGQPMFSPQGRESIRVRF